MPLTFTSTAAGTSADYLRYLGERPTKTDRKNEPSTLAFSLIPIDGSFVKLVRGNYIKLDTVTYPNWFTGYITTDPELTYIGTNSSHQPVFGYKYSAVSDEYILSLKPLGIVPPFVNTNMGTIITSLAEMLVPGAFTYTGVQAGIRVARYVPDPQAKFSDVIKSFCDSTQYRFRANNHALVFQPQDATPCGTTIDGNSKHFTPSRLTLTPSTDPIINDAVVFGDIEPQDYVNEYFVGDGLTGVFPLLTSPYGVDRTIFLDEDFSSGSFDPTKWTVNDSLNTRLAISTGYLNCLGGSNNNSYDVYLQSALLLPLEGNMRFTGGEFDFVNSASRGVNGLVCSLWSSATPGFTDINTFPGCVYGLRVNNQINMCPDSDILGTQWTLLGSMVKTVGAGFLRGNGFQYIGTGAAAGSTHFTKSQTITVLASTTYTLSGYINATNVTVGAPALQVNDVPNTTTYASVTQTAGVSGRVSVTFTTPVGVTQVKVIGGYTNNCTVTNGLALTFSDFQLELGSTATQYETNYSDTGVMDTRLITVANGVLDRTQRATLDYTKRYVIRTLVNTKCIRYVPPCNYVSASGVVTTKTGSTSADIATFTTLITEIDPTTGATTNSYTLTNSFTLSTSVWYASYCPVVSNDLHCTVTGITISTPIQMQLDITPKGGTLTQKLVGPNEIDALDGLAPVATVVDANNGITTRSSSLGTPQYNPGNASLTFFKDTTKQTATTPQVGDAIHIAYRKAGAAIGRVRSAAAIGAESTLWTDNGVRSVMRADLDPKPRTSPACEVAAAAIVGDSSYQHYDGSYTQFSTYFTQEPLAGTILPFVNLPATMPSITAEELNQVVTTIVDSRPSELFEHQLTFGRPDVLSKFLSKFRKQTDVFSPDDTAQTNTFVDTGQVGLAFSPDVVAPSLVSVDATNINCNTNQPPPLLFPNLLLFTDQFDNAAWAKNTINAVTANTIVDPLGATTAEAMTAAGGATDAYTFQTAQVVPGTYYTFSVYLKVPSGTLPFKLLFRNSDNNSTNDVVTSAALTTSWQRFTYTIKPTSRGAATFYLGTYNSWLSGVTVHVWGAQLEVGTAATVYNSNGSTLALNGGFEIRYTNESWGADDAKNLVARTSSPLFSVLRNQRGKTFFVKTYDVRNKVLFSEDLTNAAWTKDGSSVTIGTAINPDGRKSQINVLTLTAGNKRAWQLTGINPASAQVCASVSLKGTAGQTAQLVIGNNVGQTFTTLVTFTGLWQRVSLAATFNSSAGNLFFQIGSTTGTATSFSVTRASAEIATLVETVYCQTMSTAYGVVSRFPAALRVNYPLVPPPPTGVIDGTDYRFPIIRVTLPALLQDVWGLEIRAGDNLTVFYHKDLTDATFSTTFTGNNVGGTLNLSYYIYTYNLLGEYST